MERVFAFIGCNKSILLLFYYFSIRKHPLMLIHNNFQDFVLFLYLHMAMADGSLHHAEEELIVEKMAKLYPQEKEARKKLDEAITQYRSVPQEVINEIIKHSFKHFDTIKFAQRYKLYVEMYDIINADGKVDEAEKKALESLKEIINMNAETSH
jgi:uncharacterized tellurite resistance protein B-like protein